MRLDSAQSEPESLPEATTPRRTGLLVAGGVLAALLVVVAGIAFLVPGDRPTTERQARVDPDPGTAVDESAAGGVPALPTDLRGTLAGTSATFTWTEDAPGDTYSWGYLDADAQEGRAESEDVDGPPIQVDAREPGTCIWLRPVRDGATPLNAVRACAR